MGIERKKFFIKISTISPVSEVEERESIYDQKETGGPGEDKKIVSLCCCSCLTAQEENTGEHFCCFFSPAVIPVLEEA